MRASDLAGRQVALYGFGRDTRAAYRYLRASLGDQPMLLLLDHPPVPDDAASDPHLEVRVGDAAHRTLRRGEVDVVVRSPGVSIRVGPLAEADRRVTVVTSLAFLLAELTVPAIGVTGTKGKSSTSTMIAHLLGRAGHTVGLAGNIGTPALSLLGRDLELVVLELSSYQLADLDAELAVGVLLNLYREHLDWHGDYPTYVRDKARILELSHIVVANADHPEVRALAADHQPVWWSVGEHAVQAGAVELARDQLRSRLEAAGMVGVHHLGNAAAALAAVGSVGVDPAAAADWLSDTPTLRHRLEVVTERDGVRWVDDSISTIPESTIAAVDTFDGQPITLLLGGHDRGQDHRLLAERLASATVTAVLAMPDTGHRAAGEIAAAGCPVEEVAGLEEAVRRAAQLTPSGGVVLLSPAAPSYGRFRDFEDRGDRFAELIVQLS